MSITVVANSATNAYSGLSGFTDTQCRVRINASDVQADAGSLRILLGWLYPSGSLTISSMYVGHKGVGDYDFDGTQVQVFFGAAAGKTFLGADVWSDWVDYVVDKTRDLIISFFPTTSALPAGATSTSRFFASATTTGTDPAATLAGSMSPQGRVVFVQGVEGEPAVIVYTPVSNGLVGEYGLYEEHLEQGLEGQYHLLHPIDPVGLVGMYSFVMEQALVGRYGDAALISAALVGRYGSAAQIVAALVGRYGDTLQVLAALESRYHLMHSVLAGVEGRYAICGAEVLAGLEGRYDLRERNEIAAALVGYYSLLPGATLQSITCPVLIGGVAVKWSAVQWTVSESSYLIEATISLRDGAEFGSISKNDQVTITWQGTNYTLFVASKLRSRSVSGSPGAVDYGVDYTIVARSLTAGLDEPYALPTTLSWPAATLASTIAAQLIAPLSDILTLDWRLEDWLQPGGTFFLTDETPLAGLRKLAGTVGGILQTSPGNALIIRKADPVAPKDWSTTAPAWTIEDSGLFSDSESEDISSLYNVITVTNQSATDSSIRFETEEIDSYRHRVKGYRVPWVDFTLATSGGAWVAIEDMGIVEEQIVETVEFVDGASSTTDPVYSAVSAVWLRSQLGAITASEDGSLTSEVTGCSLAEVAYTTKYHSWIGRSDRDEEVQFYAVELP